MTILLRLRAKWWAIRPGFAPELYRPTTAPWLSRMAGRPVHRPGAWDVLAARIRATIQDTLVPAFVAMSAAVQTAGQAFDALGVAFGKMRAWPGEATAGKATVH